MSAPHRAQKQNGDQRSLGDFHHGHAHLLLCLYLHCNRGVDVAPALLCRDLAPLAESFGSAAFFKPTIDQLLIQLASKDHVRVGRPGRFLLSSKGAQALALELGVTHLPKMSWAEALNGCFVARALGFKPTVRCLGAILSYEGLVKAILISRYHLDLKPSLTNHDELCLAVQKQMFVEGEAGFGLTKKAENEIQLLKDNALPALCRSLLKAKDETVASLCLAIQEQFLTLAQNKQSLFEHLTFAPGQPLQTLQELEEHLRPENIEASQLRPLPLDQFAKCIIHIAGDVAIGWSGSRLSYVSAVWNRAQELYGGWGLDENGFKNRLLEAHRANFLTLATADLRDKANLYEIEQSAINYKNSQWHFIRIEE